VQVKAVAAGNPVGKEGRRRRAHALGAGKIVGLRCIRLTQGFDGVYGYARRYYRSSEVCHVWRALIHGECVGNAPNEAPVDGVRQY
jgi:hypothetical protein